MPNITDSEEASALICRVEKETGSFGVYVDDGMCLRGSARVGCSVINWGYPISPDVSGFAADMVVREVADGILKGIPQ